MKKNAEGTYDFVGTVSGVSLKAVWMLLGERVVSLPRSVCTFVPEEFAVGDQIEVVIPIWLAEKEELEDEAE